MTLPFLILFAFFFSFLISLLITPFIGKFGVRLGAVDRPDERKIHRHPIPRIGGLAIFLSFGVAALIGSIMNVSTFQALLAEKETIFLLLGSLACFGAGLVDDFRALDFKIKFLLQILGGTTAYLGGVQIENVLALNLNLYHPLLGYGITLFWFLLLINAVNLIDGLDGLAGGITMFVSLITGLFAIWRGQYAIAMMFLALSGATLGFLRYNFNPATIFMGDGGSYFIGYLIAGLSILGTSKGQTGAVLLTLLVAMGIPVFDTVLSPIRRFILGQKLFHPDKSHIHHRLLAMGFSTRKVVLTLYGISILLSIVSIILVNFHDGMIGLLLIILGLGAMVLTRKLGYFEYFALDKIYGWMKDITDEAGLNRERRTFLSLQIEIADSKTPEEIWPNICRALEKLKFSRAEFYLDLNGKDNGNGNGNGKEKQKEKEKIEKEDKKWEFPPMSFAMDRNGIDSLPRIWSRGQIHSGEDPFLDRLLKIDLPLVNGGDLNFGSLRLIKDLREGPIDYYTLRRVESLRRSVVGAMDKMARANGVGTKDSGHSSLSGNHWGNH